MQASKLIHYLSKCTASELRRFQDFVHSPYFNKHENTSALLDYLITKAKWTGKHLEMERIYAHLFPGENFEEQRLRTLMSYLVDLFRRFYGQQQYESREERLQLNTLEHALSRSQEKLFELNSNAWERRLKKQTRRDGSYFRQQAHYLRLQNQYDLQFGKRTKGQLLEDAIAHFDTYYLSEKLRLSCQLLARQQITGHSYQWPLLPQLIAYIETERSHFEHIPSVWLYYLTYQMLSQQSGAYYRQLKARLSQDAELFQVAACRDLYTHALNFCIGRLNTGQIAFKQAAFDLYQEMLNLGLLYRDKALPQWDYTNIVLLGCDLEAHAWVGQFIETQKAYLPAAERKNTYTYNLAAWHYAQQHYDQAQRLLQQVAFTDINYNLLTRVLLLKIYFDTQDWQTLDYFLDTFQIYLRRHRQMGETRRRSGLNLIRHTRALAELVENRDMLNRTDFTDRLRRLHQHIEEDEQVLSKAWLLERVENM